jgi:hypothetical protein
MDSGFVDVRSPTGAVWEGKRSAVYLQRVREEALYPRSLIDDVLRDPKIWNYRGKVGTN